jgi:hypothetical protein
MTGMPYTDDYYAVLQVDGSASPEDIRNAFRRMILRHHPDLNAGHPNAAESTILLYEAYETLSDPVRRADYDAQLRQTDKVQEQPKRRSRIWKRALVEPEPVVCQRCGHCDDTLRPAEFQVVTGLLWRTDRGDRTGIYCSLCRFLLGTRWSLQCALFGWWSITGPFWTLRALSRNLLGAPAKASDQKDVLLLLAKRLVWIQQLRDAERVVRRLVKLDPENPAIPEMIAEIALLLDERTLPRRPLLAARRLPPPAVSYLTIAIPVWLSIHYYPLLARWIMPETPKAHPAAIAPGLAAVPGISTPASPELTGEEAFRWELGDALYADPSKPGSDGSAKAGVLSEDTPWLDDSGSGYHLRDYDWTNRTSSEILKPGVNSSYGASSVSPLSQSAPGSLPAGSWTIWGDNASANPEGAYQAWEYQPYHTPGGYSTGR